MKRNHLLDRYRDKQEAMYLLEAIKSLSSGRRFTFMEVCGTHTMAMFRYGLKELLLPEIEVLSGPGCPVCVTSNGHIDTAIAFSRKADTILCTFGDMMKVPGTSSSLVEERSRGARIELVYSALDAVDLAQRFPGKRVMFFAIGFETTVPTIAAALVDAKRRKVSNLTMLFAVKLIPPGIEAVLSRGEAGLDGLLCPGHVSVITGARIFRPIARTYCLPCVIAGFEPVDILKALHRLVVMALCGNCDVANEYGRVVQEAGNRNAQRLMSDVFVPSDALWRGLGTIPFSGLSPRASFGNFDAERVFQLSIPEPEERVGCMCGEVLRGTRKPPECTLFRRSCTPERPAGPCMVSSEGSCAAYYKYS